MLDNESGLTSLGMLNQVPRYILFALAYFPLFPRTSVLQVLPNPSLSHLPFFYQLLSVPWAGIQMLLTLYFRSADRVTAEGTLIHESVNSWNWPWNHKTICIETYYYMIYSPGLPWHDIQGPQICDSNQPFQPHHYCYLVTPTVLLYYNHYYLTKIHLLSP